MEYSLNGRSILVIGGGSGMGLATAKLAKAEGAEVTIVGRNSERTAQVAQENAFSWRVADIAQPEPIQKALSDVPQVDHLAILAGSLVVGSLLDADINHLRRAFDERIWGAIYTIRALGDRLSNEASITLISGLVVDRPSPGVAVLAAAAAGVEVLAKGLALELAPRRFNTVSPGTTNTPLLVKAFGDEASKSYVASVEEKVPLRRVATAEQIANVILFLMKNEVMNAETIHVDGGQRLI